MKILLALASIASVASAQINTCAFPLTCSGGTIRHAAQDGTLHVPKTFGVTPGSVLTTQGVSGDAAWRTPTAPASDSSRASHIADSAKVAGFPNWNHDASYRFIGDPSQNGSTYATTSGMVTNNVQTNIFAPTGGAIHLGTDGAETVLLNATQLSVSVPIYGTLHGTLHGTADSSRVSGLSDSAKALVRYARTTALHDTADTLRQRIKDTSGTLRTLISGYQPLSTNLTALAALPGLSSYGYMQMQTPGNFRVQAGVPWSDVISPPSSFPPSGTAGGALSGTYPNPTISGTANTIPKFSGSALVPSSWTDSASVFRTTTTDTLIAQNAEIGNSAQNGSDAYIGRKGLNTNSLTTRAGLAFTSAGGTWADGPAAGFFGVRSAGAGILLANANGVGVLNLNVHGVDTVGSGTGAVVSNSGVRSTLSGTNLVLGNGSTIAQSTFQAAGSYLPVNNPTFTGALTGPHANWRAYSGTADAFYGNSVTPGATNYGVYIAANGTSTQLNGTSNSTLNVNDVIIVNATSTGAAVTGTLSASGAFTANGTGTAISAPNGAISTGKTLIVGSLNINTSYPISTSDVGYIAMGTVSSVFTVTLPTGDAAGKIRYISNSGFNGVNVTIAGAFGSPISLAPGKLAVCIYDGANWYVN